MADGVVDRRGGPEGLVERLREQLGAWEVSWRGGSNCLSPSGGLSNHGILGDVGGTDNGAGDNGVRREDFLEEGLEWRTLLPGRSPPERGLVEWFEEREGSGAGNLALALIRGRIRAGKILVVLDPRGQVYPPALAAMGIPLEGVVFLRALETRDRIWAWDQALRSPAVGAVWGYMERIPSRDFRRWQLAAEQGGTLGMVVRSAKWLPHPSWADLGFLVRPVPPTARAPESTAGASENTADRLPGKGREWRRAWRVTLVRSRGGYCPKGEVLVS